MGWQQNRWNSWAQPGCWKLSHMGYLFGLLDALAVPETARAALLDLLREKNAHELRAAAKAAGLNDAGADTLCAAADPLRRLRRDAGPRRGLLQKRRGCGLRSPSCGR